MRRRVERRLFLGAAQNIIQITDAMQVLADTEGMFAYQFEGERYDTGRPFSLLTAQIAMGLRHPEVGPELRAYLRGLDLSEPV